MRSTLAILAALAIVPNIITAADDAQVPPAAPAPSIAGFFAISFGESSFSKSDWSPVDSQRSKSLELLCASTRHKIGVYLGVQRSEDSGTDYLGIDYDARVEDFRIGPAVYFRKIPFACHASVGMVVADASVTASLGNLTFRESDDDNGIYFTIGADLLLGRILGLGIRVTKTTDIDLVSAASGMISGDSTTLAGAVSLHF